MLGATSHLMQVLDSVLKGVSEPSELREAVHDFLIAYSDARDAVFYAEDDPMQPGLLAAEAVAEAVRSGDVAYPLTQEGSPMVPGRSYRRPDGSLASLVSITFGNPRVLRHPVVLTFDDGENLPADVGEFSAIVQRRR